ncbi:MAG: hypothetical protein EBY39_02925 [Flavobacteriia bacterium]|nr:hypothetical protein [Flavobacteriia bacterium]
MIKITIHPNFKNWFNVSVFGRIIDQVTCDAEALEIAKTIARKEKQSHIVNLGELVQIEDA